MYIELQTQLELLKKDMKVLWDNWRTSRDTATEEKAMISYEIAEKIKELETLLANLEDF